jgi:hypothetical protein
MGAHRPDSTILEDTTGFCLDLSIKAFDGILYIPENYEDDLIDDEDITSWAYSILEGIKAAM